MLTLRHSQFGGCSKAGQALAELAVFGSLFILILGALINYGLKYSYQQQAQQIAFRRALEIAADPDRGQGTYVMLEEQYTPDPSHTHGVGSTAPFTSAATVVRDYQMFGVADTADSLPTTVLDMKVKNEVTGEERWERKLMKTAGFRLESNVPKKATKKYEVIYGTVYALHQDGDRFVPVSKKKVAKHCPPPATSCDDKEKLVDVVRIIDSCSGEVIDYKTCYKQARMLVDVNFCTTECNLNKAQGADINCSDVCSKETHPPNQTSNAFSMTTGGAWYAANWTSAQCPYSWETCYTFPVLEHMFNAFGSGDNESKVMGMQSDTTMDAERSTSMRRIESPSGITTEDSANWSDRWRRAYVTQNNLCQAGECVGLNPAVVGGVPESSEGYEKPHASAMDYRNVSTEEIESVYSGEMNETWDTPK
ncbi:MAG: hypothetical protein V1863_01265 [Candidatus Omnitrophota bacterium]